MSDQRFDLSFSGVILPGADPALARRRLAEAFKLSEQDGARLFSGRPMLIKRQVDAATAARVEQVFARVGAVLTISPIADPDATGRPAAAPPAPPTLPASPAGAPAGTVLPPKGQVLDVSGFSLAPAGEILDHTPAARPPALDLSRLSLVPGQDWTLTDCTRPPAPIPAPDISKLSLEPLPPRVEYPHDPELD